MRAHLARRIPATALARVRRSAPFHVDADAWFTTRAVDLDALITVVPDDGMRSCELHGRVARWVMDHLDPGLPPFRIVIVPRVEGGQAAVFLTILHALADGVGFQPSWRASPTTSQRTGRVRLPSPSTSASPTAPEWFVRAGVAGR